MSSNSRQIITAAAFGALVSMQGCGSDASSQKKIEKTVEATGAEDQVVKKIESAQKSVTAVAEKLQDKVEEKIEEAQDVAHDIIDKSSLPEDVKKTLKENKIPITEDQIKAMASQVVEGKIPTLDGKSAEQVQEFIKTSTQSLKETAAHIIEDAPEVENAEEAKKILEAFVQNPKMDQIQAKNLVGAMNFALHNKDQFSEELVEKAEAAFHKEGSKWMSMWNSDKNCFMTRTLTPEQLQEKIAELADSDIGHKVLKLFPVNAKLSLVDAQKYAKIMNSAKEGLTKNLDKRVFAFLHQAAKTLKGELQHVGEDVKEVVEEAQNAVQA